MYLIKKYFAGQTIEVQKTYTARQAPRNVKADAESHRPTREAVQKYNQKLAERELARILNANFQPRDLHLVLTYRRGERPDEAGAKRDLDNFIERARRYYRKRGKEFKWVATTARGERGALHHHLIISRMDVLDLPQLWSGGYHYTPLYRYPDYTALAVYIAHQNRSVLTGDGVIRRRRWSGSKNLVRPKPEVKQVDAKTWREPPKPVKGYIISPESIDAGINPVTGIPYLFYRMVRIPDNAAATTEDGVRLRGKKAIRYLHDQNERDIREHWNPQERCLRNIEQGGDDNDKTIWGAYPDRERGTAMFVSLGGICAGGASRASAVVSRSQ